MKIQADLDADPKNLAVFQKLKGKMVSREYDVGILSDVFVKNGKVVGIVNWNPNQSQYPITLRVGTRVVTIKGA